MGLSSPNFQKTVPLLARRDAHKGTSAHDLSSQNCMQPVRLDPSRDSAEINLALSRVVSHNNMKKSPKLRAFLEFVVNETLAGRGDRLKAYSIAISALGRSAAFDSVSDPIVRVEASRLRRYLKNYYDTDGLNDDIRITLPTGSYQPVFERAGSRASLEDEELEGNQDPVVLSLVNVAASVTKGPVEAPILHRNNNPKSSFAAQFQRAFLVANTVLMLFAIALGLKVLIEIENITGHIERFEKYWGQHLTAKVE